MNFGQTPSCIIKGLTFCKVGKFPSPTNLNVEESKIASSRFIFCSNSETFENLICFALTVRVTVVGFSRIQNPAIF